MIRHMNAEYRAARVLVYAGLGIALALAAGAALAQSAPASPTAYSVKQLPPDCNAEFVRGVEYQHCGGLHMKQEGDRWVQVYTH